MVMLYYGCFSHTLFQYSCAAIKSLATSDLFDQWNYPTKTELEYDSLPMPDDQEIYFEGPMSGTVVYFGLFHFEYVCIDFSVILNSPMNKPHD